MGNKELNLAEPIKNKIFKSYENDSIRVGICLMQGWRKTMEDITLALPNFDGENSLFGIFDGHGGSIISQFVACNIDSILKNLDSYKKRNYEQSMIDSFIIMDELLKNIKIDRFLKKIKNLKKNQQLKAKSIISNELMKNNVSNDPNSDYLFFSSSDLDIDTNFKFKIPDIQQYLKSKKKVLFSNNQNKENFSIRGKNDYYKKKRCSSQKKSLFYKKDISNNSFNKIKYSFVNKAQDIESELGLKLNVNSKENIIDDKCTKNLISNNMGTGANLLLLKRNCFYIANIGDSLSVMYKKKKAIKINTEHKTTNEKEFVRIMKGGGNIQNFRINGKLNITRTIGDLNYKNKCNDFFYEQDIIPIPNVYKNSLDNVDFIVMGSDGFWDYGESEQNICEFINDEIKKDPKRDLCELIGSIFDKGLAKANNYLRGTDNMSCIIIQFIK